MDFSLSYKVTICLENVQMSENLTCAYSAVDFVKKKTRSEMTCRALSGMLNLANLLAVVVGCK